MCACGLQGVASMFRREQCSWAAYKCRRPKSTAPYTMTPFGDRRAEPFWHTHTHTCVKGGGILNTRDDAHTWTRTKHLVLQRPSRLFLLIIWAHIQKRKRPKLWRCGEARVRRTHFSARAKWRIHTVELRDVLGSMPTVSVRCMRWCAR